MSTIKVSAYSPPSAVAGAIAGIVREQHPAEVHAIGAGAVNRAMKAVDLAIGCLELDEIHVHCVLEFADVTIDDKVRAAIKMIVEPQDIVSPPTASIRLLALTVHSQGTADPDVVG